MRSPSMQRWVTTTDAIAPPKSALAESAERSTRAGGPRQRAVQAYASTSQPQVCAPRMPAVADGLLQQRWPLGGDWPAMWCGSLPTPCCWLAGSSRYQALRCALSTAPRTLSWPEHGPCTIGQGLGWRPDLPSVMTYPPRLITCRSMTPSLQAAVAEGILASTADWN